MKQEITKSQFHDAFLDCGRENQFSYEGKNALYEWLEDLSEATGEEYSLDVIALCCEFTEYDSAEDAAKEYFDFEGMTYDEETGEELETPEEVEAKAEKYLRDRTVLIQHEKGVIIQNL